LLVRTYVWRMSRFSDVEILTYAVMGNHFHLLIRILKREQFLKRFKTKGGEEKFFTHLKLFYSKAYITQLKQEMSHMHEHGMDCSEELNEVTNVHCEWRL